jgi:hypothetical protein
MATQQNDLKLFIEQNTSIKIDSDIFMQMWDIITGDEWSFLSPDIIVNDMGFASARNFYSDNLCKFYQENSDYKKAPDDYPSVIAFQLKLNRRGGPKSQFYIVTKKTMTILLCKSKRAKADRYLEHFYEMQRLIVEYYKSREQNDTSSLIALMSTTHIATHTTQQAIKYTKLEEKKQTGFVYFVYEKDNEKCFKIGYSNDVSDRIAKLQTGNSRELVCYCTLASIDMSGDEAYLHHWFSNARIRGEWFAITFADVDAAIAHMKERDVSHL